jgi:hypothetical protein
MLVPWPHFSPAQNLAIVLFEDSLKSRPEPSDSLSQVLYRVRLSLLHVPAPRLRNRLPDISNPAFKCPHFARQVDAFGDLRDLRSFFFDL